MARQGMSHDFLQHFYHSEIIRRCEREGISGALGPPGAPNAVNVGIGRIRHVIVDHMRNILYIQAAGSDICSNHDLVLAALETIEG